VLLQGFQNRSMPERQGRETQTNAQLRPKPNTSQQAYFLLNITKHRSR
jgi:hypothetical protein